jgi:hypothetical protein
MGIRSESGESYGPVCQQLEEQNLGKREMRRNFLALWSELHQLGFV